MISNQIRVRKQNQKINVQMFNFSKILCWAPYILHIFLKLFDIFLMGPKVEKFCAKIQVFLKNNEANLLQT